MSKHTFPFQTFFFVHGKIKRHLIFILSFFSWVSLRTRRFLKKFIFVLTWTVSPILIFFVVVVHGKIKRHWYLPWVFSAEFRLGLAEFLKSSYLFLHGQCLLHWSMSLQNSQVQWGKYQQSLESQLIAIMRTFQRKQPFDQICLKVRSKDIVRKLISVNMWIRSEVPSIPI